MSETAWEEDLLENLKDVVDPELGINIVDLGLVYQVVYEDALDRATVHMTLTSAACPLTDVIEDQIQGALVRSGMVSEAAVEWVWVPPWSVMRISDEGREQLSAMGFMG